MQKLKSVNKFIAAAVGVGVAFGLLDTGTAQFIVAVLTPIAVWAIPND